MGLLGRIFGKHAQPPAAQVVRQTLVPDGAVEYAYWLNDQFTRLSDIDCEFLPYRFEAMARAAGVVNEPFTSNDVRRMKNLASAMLGMQEEAKVYSPPQDHDWEWPLGHEWYRQFIYAYSECAWAIAVHFEDGETDRGSSLFDSYMTLWETKQAAHDASMQRILDALPPARRAAAEKQLGVIWRRAAAKATAIVSSSSRTRDQWDTRPPDDWNEQDGNGSPDGAGG